MLERYLIPIAPYALLAAGAIVWLLFFVSLQKEISRLKSRLKRRQETGLASGDELRSKLEGLANRLRDAEERAGIVTSPVSLAPSMNLNKRTQVLRMSRRGEPASNIAASLSIPRKEVELLLKIYGLTLSRSNEITS